MLFIALTRRSIQGLLPRGASRQFSVSPDWVLTCAADDFLSRLVISRTEIAVRESLLAGNIDPEFDVSFITASFVHVRQILQISKSSLSGRPFYYCVNSRGEFLGSTHIAWLRTAGVDIVDDKEALPELLVYRTVAPPRTMYRGIRQMRLAGTVVVEVKGGELRVSEGLGNYDPLDYSLSGREEDVTERVAEALKKVVTRLAPVTTQVTTLLSGGVDSSILSTIARDELSAYTTYSTSFPFDAFQVNPEQEYALSAAAALGTRHSLFIPTRGDFLNGFVEALAIAEAPLHHLQSILLHLLFKSGMADQGDRIISGEGADSAFGMETQFILQRPTVRRRLLSLPPCYLALQALHSSSMRARELLAYAQQTRNLHLAFSDVNNPIWSYGVYGDFNWVRDHYGVSHQEVIAHRCQQTQQLANRSFNDALAIYALDCCEVSITTTLWSKLAEGQRKILYYPFVSQELLNTAFSIPWELKLKSVKHVLRRVGRQLSVPEFILNRPKQSFGIASDRWAERGGALEPLITLAAKAVDKDQLRDLQGRDPRKAMTLWSLLNYALLKRLFVMGESPQSLLDELSDNCAAGRGAPEVPSLVS